MDEQNKCVMPDDDLDYEMECRRLWEQNDKMSQEIKAMKNYFEGQRRENEILNAKLEMVYLIFGGRNYG